MSKEARKLDVPFIRQWRNYRELSLDALAQSARVDKGNLSKVERGLLPYNQEMLESLAKILGTSPAALIGWPPQDVIPFWSRYEKSPPAVQRHIDATVGALLDSLSSSKA